MLGNISHDCDRFQLIHRTLSLLHVNKRVHTFLVNFMNMSFQGPRVDSVPPAARFLTGEQHRPGGPHFLFVCFGIFLQNFTHFSPQLLVMP